MYRLVRDNVVKLTDDADKRDRLISEGFRWDEGKTQEEKGQEEKSPKGKAADDGKRTEKP